MTSAAGRAAAKPIVEARLSGIAENSAPTDSTCAVSLGEAGRDSAGATKVVETSGEVRPPGFVECSGTGLAESLG